MHEQWSYLSLVKRVGVKIDVYLCTRRRVQSQYVIFKIEIISLVGSKQEWKPEMQSQQRRQIQICKSELRK